jgi:hypothetical protein
MTFTDPGRDLPRIHPIFVLGPQSSDTPDFVHSFLDQNRSSLSLPDPFPLTRPFDSCDILDVCHSAGAFLERVQSVAQKVPLQNDPRICFLWTGCERFVSAGECESMPIVARWFDRRLCCQPLHPFLEFIVGSPGQDYEPDELDDRDGGGTQLTVAIRMSYMNSESSD